MLSMLGLKSNETGRVSEEELRLIVTGAKMSGGIESQEGMMIEGVLDLQVIFRLCVGPVFQSICLSIVRSRRYVSSLMVDRSIDPSTRENFVRFASRHACDLKQAFLLVFCELVCVCVACASG